MGYADNCDEIRTVTAPTPSIRWAARAAELIGSMRASCQSPSSECIKYAFDDPDARVRGIAWCLLGEFADDEAGERAVIGAIRDDYVRRVRMREGDDAPAFVLCLHAHFLTLSADEVLQQLRAKKAGGG
ncbi:MAG TPA: hypothetical protein PK867_09555 [Pirellulales bacterium]|nr:hypothetical protein [Pirellulales bacterium]